VVSVTDYCPNIGLLLRARCTTVTCLRHGLRRTLSERACPQMNSPERSERRDIRYPLHLPVSIKVSHMDYAFKIGAMTPQEERFACMMGNPHDKSAKIANVEAAVLFVQFEDGSTWGDDRAGKGMLAERPQKLAYLKRLVYYESGDAAFAALLDEPEPMSPEFTVASCLKGEADEKTSTIDLAKKRLAAGLQWHAPGIF